jgi:mutator protein MutT
MNIEILKNIIAESALPGERGHILMTPRTQHGIARPRKSGKLKPKKSAVMLLLTSGSDGLDVIFTLRSSKLRSHSGQISFPGGKIDHGETPVKASKRETREEIGIPENEVEIIGDLTHIHVPPSNSDIYPFVGYTERKPFINSPEEVEELITAPLRYVADPANIKMMERVFDGTKYQVPYIDIHPKVPLWGATGIIIGEMMQIISDSGIK